MIFIVFIIIVIYTIAFVLSYVLYAYFINKKEKKFILSKYSKWSLIVSNTFIIGIPLLLIIDHFKNNYLKEVQFRITTIIYYLFYLGTFLFFNNLVIEYVYEVKFLKKLSDKTKYVGKQGNSLNKKLTNL